MTTKTKSKTEARRVRILPVDQYPAAITAGTGYSPDVVLALEHPTGTYWVEDHGAGHLAAMFLPRRARSRSVNVGGASSLAGALARISHHEDMLAHPDAAREWGQRGPVSVELLGRRTQQSKAPTELDREIELILRSR